MIVGLFATLPHSLATGLRAARRFRSRRDACEQAAPATLPHSLATCLRAHGVSAHVATRVSKLPPVSVLFAAFLGYNPAQKLLGPHVLARLPAHSAAAIRGAVASSRT